MQTATTTISTSSGRPLSVLIVEDESLLSLELEMMLEDWGHMVAGTASSGAAAISMALELRPDLVLMDINLGAGIDGIAAARAIRAACDTRFVFMTAYADHDIASRLDGFDGTVLQKPLSLSRLKGILSESAGRGG